MNKKETIKIIKNIDYYRQGCASKPLYVSYPAKACEHFYLKNKPLPYCYKYLFFRFDSNLANDWIAKKDAKKIVVFYLNKQRNDENFIKKAKIHWDKFCLKPYLNLLKILDKSDFSLWSNNELLNKFELFSYKYMAVWRNSIFHDAFDIWGEETLNKALNQEKSSLSDEELKLFLSTTQVSLLQQERMDLLILAEFVLKDKRMVEAIISGKINEIKDKFPSVHDRLKKHSERYYWLHNDYSLIERLDEKYFLKELGKIVKKPVELKFELKEKRLRKNFDSQKSRIFKGKKISKRTQNVVNLLAFITYWRDERKACNQMAGNVIYKFTQEFSRRTKIAVELIEYLFWPEIIKKIYKFSRKDIGNLKERKKQGFSFFIPRIGKTDLWFGETAKKMSLLLEKETSGNGELKGRPAYPGFVKARVRLVLNKGDFRKFRPGEILVAPNTRPEYVPIMRIAKAIISEEGGITCHAAIVSRELKKPSIVGVQGATNILKDGQLVEVDANKGVVKVIK